MEIFSNFSKKNDIVGRCCCSQNKTGFTMTMVSLTTIRIEFLGRCLPLLFSPLFSRAELFLKHTTFHLLFAIATIMPATLATDSDHLDCPTPLIFASFTRCMELILFLDYGERPPASVMLDIIVKITIFWELTALPRLRDATHRIGGFLQSPGRIIDATGSVRSPSTMSGKHRYCSIIGTTL